jgi:hypothetical protein
MRFLRGDGPDITLDQVLDNNAGDDSSSSSDATSELLEERAWFAAANSRCANVLIFGRKGLPSDTFVRATGLSDGQSSVARTITIPAFEPAAPTVTESPAATVTGMEIVPWKAVLDV